MKTVALISGGKDSCFNLMCCIAEGHEVVALANLKPEKKDELDSYMFQTVGHHAIDLYSEAMDIPIFIQTIQGASLVTGRDYRPQLGDEVEDLFALLSRVKEEKDIEAVSVGAILSDYQRVRVENVCQRLNLVVLSFLWRRQQAQLLREIIDCGVKAIIIKVAAMGLDPNKHLGLQLAEIYPHMLKMRQMYGLNECGEGGEYETFVFDCPVFKKAIVIDEVEKVIHSDDAFAPVGYLNLKKCHLLEKPWDDSLSVRDRVLQLPIMTSKMWVDKVQALCTHLPAQAQGHRNIGEGHEVNSDHQTEEIKPVFHSNGKNFQVCGIRPVAWQGEDVTSVTQRTMNLLTEFVGTMGHTRADIVSVSLYVRDMDDFLAINSVYTNHFELNPPIRLCVQASLPSNVPLQLDCQGQSRQQDGLEDDRKTMHVMALSHWAPANIGPYSQAVYIGDRIFLAGMIGLVPATQRVIDGGITVQCHTALSHVTQVLNAMWLGCDLSRCPLVTCYLTYDVHIPTARAVLQSVWNDLVTTTLPLTVQFCIVPALPKAALVEWQVFAWPTLEAEEDMEVKDVKQNHECYSLSLSCVWGKERPDIFSCRITVDMMMSSSMASVFANTKEVVQNLLCIYWQHTPQQSRGQMSQLAKVFFVSSAFQYSQLQSYFHELLSRTSVPGQLRCVSLVPVLELDSPQQVLAWCQ